MSDLLGQRFGRLTVTTQAKSSPAGKRRWLCRCDCGGSAVALTNNLRRGNTQSCGCLHRERFTHAQHGMTKTPEWCIWVGMRDRCRRLKNTDFHLYGGRGITVCDRWLNSFEAFLEDMGTRPSRVHSIDRIDCDGNYEPKNCRWATPREQTRNTRVNRWIEHAGERPTLAEWAERTGISRNTIDKRLKRGWSLTKALEAA